MVFIILFCTDIVDVRGYFMLNRIPFNFLKQSDDGNGDIGKHKQGECENIKNFLISSAVNLFPFGNGGNQANKE